MKLVFRQYLASLRERGELDAVLPDLLSELGYTVISRPSVGTRQYGVDVAAISPGPAPKLYLFSIKQGDLTRQDWDGTPQALRGSINDILDVYIPTWIPPGHEALPIVICLCFGGDIHEAVRTNVSQFTRRHTTARVSFEEWNGDRLAGLLVEGVLREGLVDKELRASFQKAVAMVDEPDIAFQHFSALIRGLCAGDLSTPRRRATTVRQLYICLWVLFVWARDAGNLEGPFRASELALLHAWQVIREDVTRDTKAAQEVSAAFAELGDLSDLIWDALLGEKIIPHVAALHAVSSAVASGAAVDVNLKLFETLSRMALRGLWRLWDRSADAPLPEVRANWSAPEALDLAKQITQLINNNPVLFTPICDSQSIDIGIALLFLTMMEPSQEAAAQYVDHLIQRVVFAYLTHQKYPTIHDDYRTLIAHPREQTDAYREGETKGSTLFPLLGLWASALGVDKATAHLAEFDEAALKHCNNQFWLPADDTEAQLYVGGGSHGAALNDVPITADGRDAMQMLEDECAGETAFSKLSAIQQGHWPIVVLACRHHRLPLPPQLWLGLLRQCRQLRGFDGETLCEATATPPICEPEGGLEAGSSIAPPDGFPD